ncbi:zinc-binding dehydrogenase [Tengunoibacter tsumagoiensis]|uniref:Alcohol dehydrogenase-like C-terminal domain-containing protein n=1 Tax=Tengunoibacter tsumagoiensis TaxID=2014871 RepID=A0A402A7L4_9CHLR|nr:zinc-binding dehydrogenase [Tengunoibacter tsumagoiensis]GCE15160.1 hypothetical protein KTT_50190 [Tengunoibacter tsumagoiensis]
MQLLPVLKHGGMLIPINLGHPAASQAEAFGVIIGGKQVHANAGQLVEIGRLIDTGQVRVAIDTIVPLPKAYQAHERGEAGHLRGKIVLRVVE